MERNPLLLTPHAGSISVRKGKANETGARFDSGLDKILASNLLFHQLNPCSLQTLCPAVVEFLRINVR
jgi:hypothetical protein